MRDIQELKGTAPKPGCIRLSLSAPVWQKRHWFSWGKTPPKHLTCSGRQGCTANYSSSPRSLPLPKTLLWACNEEIYLDWEQVVSPKHPTVIKCHQSHRNLWLSLARPGVRSTTCVVNKWHVSKRCISLGKEEQRDKQASSACSPLPGENKKHFSIPVSYLSSTPSHFVYFPSPGYSLYVNKLKSKGPVKSDIALGSRMRIRSARCYSRACR